MISITDATRLLPAFAIMSLAGCPGTVKEKASNGSAPQVVESSKSAPDELRGGVDTGCDNAVPAWVGTREKLGDAEVSLPRACPDIFTQDEVVSFALELSDETWSGLAEDWDTWEERAEAGEDIKPWHEVESFTYGDETYTDVVIRLKGNPSSGWVGDKYLFVIAFDEVRSDARFHGLRQISLDAPYYDETVLRERLALTWLAEIGQIASCVNHARLDINGTYYGLYASLEVADDLYLERRFGRAGAQGDLYKWDPVAGELEHEEGSSEGSEVEELLAVTTVAEFEAIADFEQALAFWAADFVMPNCDGYFRGTFNFLYYLHPDSGWLILPWDLDCSFEEYTQEWSEDIHRDYWGLTLPLDHLLAEDPERWEAAVLAVREYYDPEVLEANVWTWNEQIADSVYEDPHKYFSDDRFDEAVALIAAFPAERLAYLESLDAK